MVHKNITSYITYKYLQEILETKGEKEKKMEDKVKSFIRRRKLSYEGDDEKRDVMKRIVSKLRSDGYNASIYGTSWDSSFDRRKGNNKISFWFKE